jgi:hypothetical protein
MCLLCILLGTNWCSTTYHMCSLNSWFEWRYTKCDLSGFFSPGFFLWHRHRVNLSNYTRSTLKTRTSVKIKLKASFYMPFNFLTKPTLAKSVTHLKANYFMLSFHQVVKNRYRWVFVLPIKSVTLNYIFSGMPLIHLSGPFWFHYLSTNVVVFTPLHFNQVVGSISTLCELIFSSSLKS